jgi:hypothetical protein
LRDRTGKAARIKESRKAQKIDKAVSETAAVPVEVVTDVQE